MSYRRMESYPEECQKVKAEESNKYKCNNTAVIANYNVKNLYIQVYNLQTANSVCIFLT